MTEEKDLPEDAKNLLTEAREIRDALDDLLYKVEKLKVPTEAEGCWDSLVRVSRDSLENKMYTTIHHARLLVGAIKRGPYIKEEE